MHVYCTSAFNFIQPKGVPAFYSVNEPWEVLPVTRLIVVYFIILMTLTHSLTLERLKSTVTLRSRWPNEKIMAYSCW